MVNCVRCGNLGVKKPARYKFKPNKSHHLFEYGDRYYCEEHKYRLKELDMNWQGKTEVIE